MNLLASFVLLAAQDPSLLIVLLDDVGAEFLEFHPMGVDAGNPASTPTLSALADEGLFDPAAVTSLIERNERGEVDASYLVYSLVCTELWCRRFLDLPVGGRR